MAALEEIEQRRQSFTRLQDLTLGAYGADDARGAMTGVHDLVRTHFLVGVVNLKDSLHLRAPRGRGGLMALPFIEMPYGEAESESIACRWVHKQGLA